MEELKFKKYLKDYLDNTLEFEKFEAFFYEMSNVEPSLLNKWINEALTTGEIGNEQKALPVDVDFSVLLEKIHQNIEEDSLPQKAVNQFKPVIRWISAIAAAFLLVAFVYKFLVSDKQEVQVISYENTDLHNISVLLPDSSEIILFPQSKISFSSNTYATSRDITHVKGKVLYKVKKAEAAFNVDYQSFVTQALGTIFIVDANERNLARVKLVEGKISVNKTMNGDWQTVILDAGGEILIDINQDLILETDEKKENISHATTTQNSTKLTSPDLVGNVVWTSELLELNQLSGVEIVNLLQQIYDVTVLVDGNEILQGRFSGSIDRGESLDDFLTNYCELNGCQFRIDNEIITIQTHQRKEGPK